tara:strand:+ start:2837 stop:3094 length:258 start_codon:yes stop_codon:yes gene_type:complete
MKAIGKYIIINEVKEEIKTSSGILLSNEDVDSFRYRKGKVYQPGTLVDTIKKGDVIYYDKSSGHSMMIQDKSYTIIEERNVVIVL